MAGTRKRNPEIMKQISSFVEEYFFEYHGSPSMQKIATAIGTSKSTAYYYVNEMAENPDESWKEQCTVLTVYDGITAICVGVLEQFPNMVKLRLPKSVTRIDMTDELNTLFHKNDVLVHAAYGSYGDTVAQNNGLRFLPENIELAWCRDEEHDESTKLVLRFYEGGSMDLLYDIFTAGISAGSNGGASLDRPMPEEYYPGCTLEEFADMFSARYHEQIMNNSELKIFLRREAERKNKDK